MPSSTLMLLERILPGEFFSTVTTLKRVVGFIMLLKSTIVDKESIAMGAEAMLRCPLMLLH